MDSKKDGTTSIAGMAKDDSLTCYNCGQIGHVSWNCPNSDLMRKLLKQALVGKDAPKAKSGHQPNDMKKGDTPTGRIESGWLAEENTARLETDCGVATELESLSDSDCEAGTSEGGQQLQLFLLHKHHDVQYRQNKVAKWCQMVNASFSHTTTTWKLVN